MEAGIFVLQAFCKSLF